MRTLALGLLVLAACGTPTDPPTVRAFTLISVNDEALPAWGESWTTDSGIAVLPSYYHEGSLDVRPDGTASIRYTVSNCPDCELREHVADGTEADGALTFEGMAGTVDGRAAEVVHRNDTLALAGD